MLDDWISIAGSECPLKDSFASLRSSFCSLAIVRSKKLIRKEWTTREGTYGPQLPCTDWAWRDRGQICLAFRATGQRRQPDSSRTREWQSRVEICPKRGIAEDFCQGTYLGKG